MLKKAKKKNTAKRRSAPQRRRKTHGLPARGARRTSPSDKLSADIEEPGRTAGSAEGEREMMEEALEEKEVAHEVER